MTGTPDAQEGGCRCGGVRFRVSGAPLFTAACHCTGCQRMAGSAYSVSGGWPAAQFALLQGEPVLGGLKGATRHYFCPECMSWLFTRPEGFDDFVNLRVTLLDRPWTEPPFLETYAATALPWARTGAAHRFETFPAPEAFGPLVADYAARQEAASD